MRGLLLLLLVTFLSCVVLSCPSTFVVAVVSLPFWGSGGGGVVASKGVTDNDDEQV